MKLNSKYISLIVLSFILVLVLGISFLSIEKSDVEEVYAAAPVGYVLASPNVLYENVEYYIDTSVVPWSAPSDLSEIYPYLGTDGPDYFGVMADEGYDVEYRIANWDDGRWISGTVVNGVIVGYPFLNIHLSYEVPYLYVKQSAPSPVIQSLPITFDSGVSSVSLGNQTWSSSGASNSVVFDDEEGYYDFTVTPVIGYKAVSATYTYLYDGDVNTYNVDIVDNQFRLLCPVGNAITSISIQSSSIYATVPLTITWDDGIESVYSVTLDTDWTESGQSNVVTYNNPSGLCSFIPTFKDGYTYHSFSFNASSSSVTALWSSSAKRIIFNVPEGESISSIDIVSRPFQNGFLGQYIPVYGGDTSSGFDVSSYNKFGDLSVLGGTVFDSFEELYQYYQDNYDGETPPGNPIDVVDTSGNSVSFPLIIDGQPLYFKYPSFTVDVAFVFDNDLFAPSFLGYTRPEGDYLTELLLGSYNFNINYMFIPQSVNQSVSGYLYFITGWYGSSATATSAIFRYNGESISVPVELILGNTGVNRALYRVSVSDVPEGLYLNQIVFSNLNNPQFVFNFSDVPGGIWSPGIDDSLSLLATIFDGVFEILELHISADITLGMILLAVLALGILMFILRVGGVF